MRATGHTPSGETTLVATKDELVLLFGGLVQATGALSPAEFRACIGLPVSDAESLVATLRQIIGRVEQE
jgi:hypothetical protein